MAHSGQRPPRGGGKRQRHAGARTCAGCGAKVPKDRVKLELVRVVLVPEEDGLRAHVDLGGSSVGRGAWMHARPECVAQACKRGLARSAKAKVAAEPERIRRELHDQALRRIDSLIGTAVRTQRAEVGSDAVRDAVRRGVARLLVVAKDAAAAARHTEVREMLQSGAGVMFATKLSLGAAMGRGDVGVVAICDDGLAFALSHTIALAEMFALAESFAAAETLAHA